MLTIADGIDDGPEAGEGVRAHPRGGPRPIRSRVLAVRAALMREPYAVDANAAVLIDALKPQQVCLMTRRELKTTVDTTMTTARHDTARHRHGMT